MTDATLASREFGPAAVRSTALCPIIGTAAPESREKSSFAVVGRIDDAMELTEAGFDDGAGEVFTMSGVVRGASVVGRAVVLCGAAEDLIGE